MRFIADLLSLFRILTVLPILIFASQNNWIAAFAWLIIGWATDLLDGLSARRFGSESDRRGIDADGIADSMLAFASSLVPGVYALGHGYQAIGYGLMILWVLSIVSGVMMVFGKGGGRMIAFNMIFFHAILQIGATIAWFAYMAYGMVGITAITVALSFVLFTQLHKIRAWIAGRFK